MSSDPGTVRDSVPPAGMGTPEALEQQAAQIVRENTRIVLSPLLASASIRHGFSTRLGGISRAYLSQSVRDAGRAQAGELNLGFTASDTRENVLENRARLLHDAFGSGLPLVTVRQVHSVTAHRVFQHNADLHNGKPEAAGAEATLAGDGLLTGEAGLALGVQTADCVPVLLADRHTGAVAAFHAGWRGTLGRIVEQGVARLREEFGTQPKNLLAAIGPAIGPCCYGVGDEVAQQFGEGFRHGNELLQPCVSDAADPSAMEPQTRALPKRKFYLDLPETNRRQLLDAGLRPEAVDLLRWCTRCRRDLFFSYRAEQGFTGRMLSVIARI